MRRTHAERLFFFFEKTTSRRVLRYGMQRFSGNIRRSMVGRAAGPVDHDRIWVQPPPYGAGLIPAVGGAVRLSAVTPEYAVTSFGPLV